jgi:hypothetical protein
VGRVAQPDAVKPSMLGTAQEWHRTFGPALPYSASTASVRGSNKLGFVLADKVAQRGNECLRLPGIMLLQGGTDVVHDHVPRSGPETRRAGACPRSADSHRHAEIDCAHRPIERIASILSETELRRVWATQACPMAIRGRTRPEVPMADIHIETLRELRDVLVEQRRASVQFGSPSGTRKDRGRARLPVTNRRARSRHPPRARYG